MNESNSIGVTTQTVGEEDANTDCWFFIPEVWAITEVDFAAAVTVTDVTDGVILVTIAQLSEVLPEASVFMITELLRAPFFDSPAVIYPPSAVCFALWISLFHNCKWFAINIRASLKTTQIYKKRFVYSQTAKCAGQPSVIK